MLLFLVLAAFAAKITPEHPFNNEHPLKAPFSSRAPFLPFKARSALSTRDYTSSIAFAPDVLDEFQDAVVEFSTDAPMPLSIGVSCGAQNSTHDYLSVLPLTAQSGRVRLPRMFAMRCVWRAALVGADGVLAAATARMRLPSTHPRGGRLQLVGAGGQQVTIMWTSAALDGDAPTLLYGAARDALTTRRHGRSATYAAAHMCNAPANITGQPYFRDPGMQHRVLFDADLPAGAVVYYKFGSEKYGYSDVRSFVTPPSAPDATRFIAYADQGTDDDDDDAAHFTPHASATDTTLNAGRQVSNGFDAFLIHFGDISYARGQAYTWDLYHLMLEPLATAVPVAFSIGNHEVSPLQDFWHVCSHCGAFSQYDHVAGGEHDPSHAPGNGFHPFSGNMGSDSNGECAVPFYYRFATPDPWPFWYSFDRGLVHVIQLSSEHDWRRGSAQWEWLKKDLISVDRRRTPFVVATSHRMMYTTQMKETGDFFVSQLMQANLDDLINGRVDKRAFVDLFLSGHQHSFQASCPIYRQQCRAPGTATVHAVVGTAGASLETGGFNATAFGKFSRAQTEQTWGLLRVTAERQRMRCEFVTNDLRIFYAWEVVPYKG